MLMSCRLICLLILLSPLKAYGSADDPPTLPQTSCVDFISHQIRYHHNIGETLTWKSDNNLQFLFSEPPLGDGTLIVLTPDPQPPDYKKYQFESRTTCTILTTTMHVYILHEGICEKCTYSL